MPVALVCVCKIKGIWLAAGFELPQNSPDLHGLVAAGTPARRSLDAPLLDQYAVEELQDTCTARLARAPVPGYERDSGTPMTAELPAGGGCRGRSP